MILCLLYVTLAFYFKCGLQENARGGLGSVDQSNNFVTDKCLTLLYRSKQKKIQAETMFRVYYRNHSCIHTDVEPSLEESLNSITELSKTLHKQQINLKSCHIAVSLSPAYQFYIRNSLLATHTVAEENTNKGV